MGALESMKKVLEPLNIYEIKKGNIVYAELCAYAQELDALNDELEIIQRELFVKTAKDYGISLKERLLGSIKNALAEESRKEILFNSFGITENDFAKSNMEKALISCGIKANILENPTENKIKVKVEEVLDSTVSTEKIQQDALEILPSHLEVVFEFNS